MRSRKRSYEAACQLRGAGAVPVGASCDHVGMPENESAQTSLLLMPAPMPPNTIMRSRNESKFAVWNAHAEGARPFGARICQRGMPESENVHTSFVEPR